jgi:hypothetical protein
MQVTADGHAAGDATAAVIISMHAFESRAVQHLTASQRICVT